MSIVAKTYRIPTSLSIARARITELLPRALELPDGTALLALDQQAQDEAYYLVLRLTEYLTRCGPWQVRATPDALRWTFAGAQVTLTPAGEAAFAGSDARAQRAIACVRARLPALRLPDALWGWRLDCRLVAVTPTETIAAWWTLRMGAVSARLEQGIGALWSQVEQVTDSTLIALLRDPNLTYEEIAEKTCYSVQTVKRRAKELQTRGLVPPRRRGRKPK